MAATCFHVFRAANRPRRRLPLTGVLRRVREQRARDLLRIVEVAIGHQHPDRRMPVRVGIDVGRDVHPLGAGGVQPGQDLRGLAPAVDDGDLHMRDLHRKTRLAADGDNLVYGRIQLHIFTAQVADIAAMAGGGGPGHA